MYQDNINQIKLFVVDAQLISNLIGDIFIFHKYK